MYSANACPGGSCILEKHRLSVTLSLSLGRLVGKASVLEDQERFKVLMKAV